MKNEKENPSFIELDEEELMQVNGGMMRHGPDLFRAIPAEFRCPFPHCIARFDTKEKLDEHMERVHSFRSGSHSVKL